MREERDEAGHIPSVSGDAERQMLVLGLPPSLLPGFQYESSIPIATPSHDGSFLSNSSSLEG